MNLDLELSIVSCTVAIVYASSLTSQSKILNIDMKF